MANNESEVEVASTPPAIPPEAETETPFTREESIEALRQQGRLDAASFEHPEESLDETSVLEELTREHPALTPEEIRLEYVSGVAAHRFEQTNAETEAQYQAAQDWETSNALLPAERSPSAIETVSDQLETQTERLAAVATELTEYASLQTALPYINAEAAMAASFHEQLANGSRNIDLSQRYDTADPSQAQARHDKALENLRPLIEEVTGIEGYTVQRGAAIAEGLRQQERQWLSQRQGLAVGL